MLFVLVSGEPAYVNVTVLSIENQHTSCYSFSDVVSVENQHTSMLQIVILAYVSVTVLSGETSI